MMGAKGRLAVGLAVAAMSFAACNAPAPAHAGPLCEHRGLEHIDRHGGKIEDDAYHRSHGERVTCEGKDDKPGDFAPYERHEADRHADERHEADRHADTDNKDQRRDDTPLPGHRDKPGYGCHMLRCG